MADKIYMNYIYPSSLLRQLSDLWKSEQMCDAVITVDKVIIAKAHKLVLLAISSKLKSDSNNSSQTAFLEVNLPSGLQHKSVNAFLQYLYEGFLLLTKEIVSDMIRIAEYLDIECLLSCCKEYKKTLTDSDKSDSESSPENGFQKDFKHVRCTITKEKSEMDKRSRDNEDSDSNSAVGKRGRKKRRKHSSDDSDNGSVSNKSFHRISKEPHHHVQLADESYRIKVEPADQDGCEVENSSVSQDSTQHSSHSLPSKSPIENVISKNSSISLLDDDIIEIKEEPDDEDFSIIESSFSNTPQNYQTGSYSNTFPGQSTPMASSSQVTPSIISRQSVSDIDYLTQRLNQDQQDLQYQDDGSGTQESYGAYDPSDGQVPGTSGSFSQEEREKHLPMYRPNFVVSQPPTHFADRHNKEVLQRERVRTSVACCVCRKPRCVYSLKKLNKEQGQSEVYIDIDGDQQHPTNDKTACDRSNSKVFISGRVREVLKCNLCQKPRCVYSQKKLTSKQIDPEVYLDYDGDEHPSRSNGGDKKFSSSKSKKAIADPSHTRFLIPSRVREVLVCHVCHKQRCVYSHKKLTPEQDMLIMQIKKKNRYKCGDTFERANSGLVMRTSLTCQQPMEMCYFGAICVSLKPCCYHCGTFENLLLKSHPYISKLFEEFSSVKPVCEGCFSHGKKAKTWGHKGHDDLYIPYKKA